MRASVVTCALSSCVKKTTMNQSPPDSHGGWYDKYGLYNGGGREAQSEWKNVRYYRK